MEAAARFVHTAPPGVIFEDGLGQRSRQPDPSGGPGTEVLTLRASFATVSSFEFAVRERAARLTSFRHASYVRVRSVERSTGPEPMLRVVSDASQGLRLSDLLRGAHARQVPIDINAALCLVRQLVPAIAMLHESAKEVAHGAIGLERLAVTPQARLQILEYILGAALEQLRFSRERHWSELRIPLPAGPGMPRFDHRSDVLQIGVTALSLILGRPLRPEEFPGRVADVVASTWAMSPRGGFEPLPPGLRGWLGRALQIDPTRSFQSAVEARAELDAVLGDSELVASPASLEAFLTRYHASVPVVDLPPTAQPTPEPQFAATPSQPQRAQSSAPTAWPAPPTVMRPSGSSEPNAPSTNVDVLALAAPTEEHTPEPATTDFSASPLLEAGEEIADEADRETPSSAWWKNWRVLGAAAAVVAVVAAGGYRTWRPEPPAPVHAASGTLEVSTSPDGAEALIDGVLRGTTPLVVALEPGGHTLELRGKGEPRTIPITINAGMKVAQYVELSRAAAAAPTSTPAPVVAPQAPAVQSPPPQQDAAEARPPARGTVSVDSPVDLQVYEAGTFIGKAPGALTLPPGRHELDAVNSELGVRTTLVAQVSASKPAAVRVDLPNGVLSVNALPWAEVWLDGEKVGETPMGNLQVRVGAHDLVFRNPDLGERHLTTVVTTKEPARVSVDLRAR